MPTPPPAEIAAVLEFIAASERLKDTERSAWTSTGRRDTVASHSWRLGLMAIAFQRQLPGLDLGRLLTLCVVHDLGEALHGDIPAPTQSTGVDKNLAERADLVEFLAPLPAAEQAAFVAAWDEYEAAVTPEAKVAKALDKLETIIQHNQGANPDDFDYAFNLDYGRQYTDQVPLLAEVRALIDARTRARAGAGE